MLAQWINHLSTPNHKQHDHYKTPPSPPPLVHDPIPSPTIMLSIDIPKSRGVILFPSLAFRNHLAHILVSDAFQRFSTQFSRNSIFWEHSTLQYFRELYFTGIFWFRKVWFWKLSQWEKQPTNKVYCPEKLRPSRKSWDVSKVIAAVLRRLHPHWMLGMCNTYCQVL